MRSAVTDWYSKIAPRSISSIFNSDQVEYLPFFYVPLKVQHTFAPTPRFCVSMFPLHQLRSLLVSLKVCRPSSQSQYYDTTSTEGYLRRRFGWCRFTHYKIIAHQSPITLQISYITPIQNIRNRHLSRIIKSTG